MRLSSNTTKDSSVEKINELYENFQHLKSRITHYRHRPLADAFANSSGECISPAPKPSLMDIKNGLGKQSQQFIVILQDFKARMLIKMEQIQLRLIRSNKTIEELRRVLAAQRAKNREKSRQIQESGKGISVVQFKWKRRQQKKVLLQVVQDYQQKIAGIREWYEEREKQKQRDGDTQTSWAADLGLEEELLKRQTEVGQWKIECSKLRRLVDQMRVHDQTQRLLIKQLEQKLIQNQSHLEIALQRTNSQSQIESVQMLGKSEEHWGEFRSMVIPRSKESMLANLKQLQAECGLIQQENKLLRNKKDYFELQLRGTEEDEQRFQRQNSLLREELKKLASQLRNLDKVCEEWITHGHVSRDLVISLDSSIKCRPLFLQRVEATLK